MIPIERIYAVEVSGVCNLEQTCTWCPMHKRPRGRKRGLMGDETATRALALVQRLRKVDALALHVFGEPLLHPKFDRIALEFSYLTPITMSTNGVLLDEKWADKLARVPWAWISVSPWDEKAAERATKLLRDRGIATEHPPGATHDWAGQATGPSDLRSVNGCPFLTGGKAVIRWDGTIASCCVTDRDEDKLGSIFDDKLPAMRGYSLCDTCHHRELS